MVTFHGNKITQSQFGYTFAPTERFFDPVQQLFKGCGFVYCQWDTILLRLLCVYQGLFLVEANAHARRLPDQIGEMTHDFSAAGDTTESL
jgi:hypothetical protein